MRSLTINYPWAQLKKGYGFFIPGLDTDKIREMGLRSAVSSRVRVDATPGIKDGLTGVWFYQRLA